MLHQLFAMFFVVLPTAMAWAQDAATVDEAKELAQSRQSDEAEAKALPTVRASGPAEVARFSIVDNHLHIHTQVKPTNNDRVRLEAPGIGGIVTLLVRGEPTPDGKPYLPEQLLLIQRDYTRSDALLVITMVSINPAQVQITRDTDLGAGGSRNVELIQSGNYLAEGEDMIHFNVTQHRGIADRPKAELGENEEGPLVALKLTAPNFVELLRRYPNETSQYLEPIFHELGQADVLFRVDEPTAWQVLSGAYEPPVELSAKVTALVKQLDAENPQQREAAAAELKTFGQPAALVLMRQDRAKLSEEQNMQLDGFLAPFKPLADEEAAKMRDDPKFLLLSLTVEDAALRKLALEQLRKTTREPIEFDVNADANVRKEAIAALRAKLLPPPATRPATMASERRAARK